MRGTMSATDENISRLLGSAAILGEEGQKRILDNYNGNPIQQNIMLPLSGIITLD